MTQMLMNLILLEDSGPKLGGSFAASGLEALELSQLGWGLGVLPASNG